MKNCVTVLRKQQKITQIELAKRVGVSRQTIIALEQERYNPSLQLAYAITQELHAKHIEDVFFIETN